MQTARRYDPTKDAKFHVSIATTEEVRRKWATPLPEWTGPKGTVPPRRIAVHPASAPDANTEAAQVGPTWAGDGTVGLSPDFKARDGPEWH